MKRCPHTGCPQLIPNQSRYCPTHLADYEARRGSPTQRGYGTYHRHLRREWADRIQAGEQPPCTRCGQPITPTQSFDLDHADNRTSYLGPAHQHCNRKAGGTRGAYTRNTH